MALSGGNPVTEGQKDKTTFCTTLDYLDLLSLDMLYSLLQYYIYQLLDIIIIYIWYCYVYIVSPLDSKSFGFAGDFTHSPKEESV